MAGTLYDRIMTETLYDKIWKAHVVADLAEMGEGYALIYIDRHLMHEVTSPQAFAGLRLSGRRAWRTAAALAVPDHNVPTRERDTIRDPVSRRQLEALYDNCDAYGIRLIPMRDQRQGIVHVIGPEQGACLPGMTIVCGDSHTATNGALGALAFGIGTSEVEQVLSTQCLVLRKARNMRVNIEGKLAPAVTAKDLVLALIGRIGTAGATGHTIEYSGETLDDLSMEGRMTICNMSIEAGARSGLVAPDDKTLHYLSGRPLAPRGRIWQRALQDWQHLRSDPEASFDREVHLDAQAVDPQVTWGTSPEMVTSIGASVPDPADTRDPIRRASMERALAYMNLVPGTPLNSIPINKVFIGSCTNSRIEDLRAAAAVARGQRVASSVDQALVVPGSGLVRKQAEEEGLARIFTQAGFEWREPGCSMCLGMNEDRLKPGERCASTSNRNFEGRQGQGGRTHLLSPPMAVAAAITGHLADVREMMPEKSGRAAS